VNVTKPPSEVTAPMKRVLRILHNMPIGRKMFYSYSLIVLAAVLLLGSSVYYIVSSIIRDNIESKLSNATAAILNMVETTAQASIKNYLRSVSEKNLEIAGLYYGYVQNGLLTEDAAKAQLKNIFLSQHIGKTGYIYCLNSRGTAVMHPDPMVEGVDFSDFEFIQRQMHYKQGYLEYEWKNPGEEQPRPKALYMVYFQPWDWIISASSYRNEFSTLINISDFKESILAQTFGKTGYSYILKSNGVVVVHPHLSGNLWDAKDANGFYLIRHQSNTKNGKFFYSWRNPNEAKFHKKLVIYNYIKEYDWIVSSTGYLEEFYAPLRKVRYIIFASILLVLLMMLPVTFIIARSITRPLHQLEKKLAQGVAGDFAVRLISERQDEIGKLSIYFNSFMSRIETYSQDLQNEIAERRKTEELFSKAFHTSPSALFIANLKNFQLIDANHRFLALAGCGQDNVVGQCLTQLPMLRRKDNFKTIIDQLKKEGHVRDLDMEFLNDQNCKRLVIFNAEMVHIWGEPCILCAMEDLTETRRLEREIIAISERERLQLGQYLHDDLCSHLAGVEVMQKVLWQRLSEQGYADISLVKKLRDLVQEAINKIGRISRGLCPTHIAEKSFRLTLTELCRDIEQIYGVTCTIQDDGSTGIADPSVATHVYYIAREAIYNAVKHGRARNIFITLAGTGESVTMRIHDDGVGLPDLTEKKGMGIRIMKYRALRIGAFLDVRKGDMAGTFVVLTFNPSLMAKE